MDILNRTISKRQNISNSSLSNSNGNKVLPSSIWTLECMTRITNWVLKINWWWISQLPTRDLYLLLYQIFNIPFNTDAINIIEIGQSQIFPEVVCSDEFGGRKHHLTHCYYIYTQRSTGNSYKNYTNIHSNVSNGYGAAGIFHVPGNAGYCCRSGTPFFLIKSSTSEGTPDKWTPMMMSSNGNISALLALCEGNSPVTGEFPSQRPVTRSFDIFYDRRLKWKVE